MNLKVASSSNGVVLAKDIELPPGFKIINPELHIATVAANTKFSMQIYATRGKGFKTFIQNRESLSSISAISTDSAFSPIIRVSYNVEEIKISRNNVGDKLIMDVVTNGSLTPTEAMAYAAKILTEHLNPIVNISKAISEIEIMNERDQQQKKQKLDTPIEELDFSVRSYNSLKRNGIHTVQDLTSMSKQKLENIRNLGKKSSREIVKRLQQMGLELVDDNK
jgi:DNA-directed RNA polymerase subunit alpha